MNKQILATSALASILALAAVQPAFAADDAKEKCYGVAKAGANDCASAAGTHSCAGQSKMDNDPNTFKLVAAGSCAKMGGMLKAPAKK
ncbi:MULTISPECIES: DUF2282 domain-containing protein [unclassified Uliginosibacterium]|jgi:uncharacterized membrane protein|uniref:BufA1 family periplasmic bufferin-type metallophore n=1 Tax=unclassified Uliginosibacterium TaxID=2621521 RepID=UPI000C7E232C|nr:MULTISPECIES: DUF2282 domain-containing protein [unclassified Uliginosibacterium]MDO6386595.1 DUF2282 domain-containing protein [Uliginosibacterium sp. 31-12]PLK50429.1 hypothetical protein C0V76_00945 [Uliginosibacterium sp. TH139]